ncbi:MAG: ABC transporter ATP-binding protein [Planctomycetota bacterium]|jgi:ABC-2 type transport system ATP-binding protein
MTAIEARSLTKIYRNGVVGVENLDLSMQRGEIAGLVGPNGSGKTTTIRLLLDFLRPTRGEAKVLGLDAHRDSVAVRRRVGFLPGDLAFHGSLSGQQTLEFYSSLRRHRPPVLRRELLDRLKLEPSVMRRRVATYSTGMRRKLGLVLALEHDPELAVLDEPTAGLDPLVRRACHEVIGGWQAQGRTLFLCTHDILEVETLCHRVLVVREGRLVASEPMEALRERTKDARSLEDEILGHYAES